MHDPPTVTLFGAFAWVPAGAEPLHLGGDRPIALLAYLLLHRDVPVSRAHLAASLWPESTDGQARTNLRNLLFTLRHALPDAARYLAVDATTMRWRTSVPLDLDVATFEARLLAAEASEEPGERARHLEAAVACYRGDLLEGRYDAWLGPLRDDYRGRWRDALRVLVASHAASGDAVAARHAAERCARVDPLDEVAAIDLIRCCAALGDRSGARHAFDAHAAALAADLDVEPSPAAHAALEAALSTTPSAQAIPLAGEPIAPRTLPTPGTPFVGREAECGLVNDRLDDPACRMLTLVGPGGFGKTRLALAVARARAEKAPDDVAWVDLAGARTPERAVAAIAEALHVHLRGAEDPAAELARALALRRHLLLVLDGAEGLVDGARLLSRLLADAPGLTVLVTSRRAFTSPEAWRFELDALPLPAEGADPRALAANDAVRLFLHVARRIAGRRSPSKADLPDVARVCRAVGGVPLAVELAASWARLLTPAEIAVEIAGDLDFLSTDDDDTGRHRSLRAVFDQSWALLGTTDQVCLARLATFEAGFGREAAARVADADVRRLAALVDRSLVQRGSDDRYRLHPLVRQYAAERLRADPDVAEVTAERHAAFALGGLAQQTGALQGARQIETLAAIAAELPDVHAAWRWAASRARTDLLLDAAFPLFYFFELRGALVESVAVFDMMVDVLAAVEATAHDRRRCVALARAFGGFAAFRMGHLSDAQVRLDAAVAALAGLDAPEADGVTAHLARHVGLLRWAQGSFDTAQAQMEASGAAAARVGDAWSAAMAEAYLGMIGFDRSDLDDALVRLEAVLPAARELGDPRLVGNVRLILGRVRLLLDQPQAAEVELRACLTEASDPNSVGYATLYLGSARRAQGAPAEGRALLDRALEGFDAVGDAVGRARAHLALAFVDLEEGEAAAARSRLRMVLGTGPLQYARRDLLSLVVAAATASLHAGDVTSAHAWTEAVLHHPGADFESRRRALALRDVLPDFPEAEPAGLDAVVRAVRRSLEVAPG